MKTLLKSLLRRKEKSLLYIILFSVLGTITFCALEIRLGCKNYYDNIISQLNPIVRFEIKPEYLNLETFFYSENDDLVLYLSNEFIDSVYADERVNGIDCIAKFSRRNIDFDVIPLRAYGLPDKENNGSFWSPLKPFGSDEYTLFKMTDYDSLTLLGIKYENLISFLTGYYQLIEGRVLNEEDILNSKPVCLITDELAEYNNLKVGDAISITYLNTIDEYTFQYSEKVTDYLTEEDFAVTYEIVGIYHTKEEANIEVMSMQCLGTAYLPGNKILIPLTTINDVYSNVNTKVSECLMREYGMTMEEPIGIALNGFTSFDVLLNSITDVNSFMNKWNKEIPSTYSLSSYDEQLNRLLTVLDLLRSFADISLAILLFISVIILSLVIALDVTERKKELGLYLSLGIRKEKIIRTIIMELFTLFLISFFIAVSVGNYTATKLSEKAMNILSSQQAEYEKASSEKTFQEIYDEAYAHKNAEITMDAQQAEAEFNIELNSEIIFVELATGIGLVFLSALIPCLFILKSDPIQIMMEE